MARVEKPPGQAEIRLFGESADAQRAMVIRRTGLDIAIAGFGASWADAEHNDIFSRNGDLDSSAESRAVLGRMGNALMEGKQTDHRLGIVTKQKKRRQSNRGRCIAPGGLSDDLLRVKLWKLTKNSGTKVVVRDDPKTTGRGHGCEARYGLLDHGVLAVERKQLLGAALAAQRPEPRASAASQNHGIEVRVRFHVVESLPSAHRAAKSSPQGAQGITGATWAPLICAFPCAPLCSLW